MTEYDSSRSSATPAAASSSATRSQPRSSVADARGRPSYGSLRRSRRAWRSNPNHVPVRDVGLVRGEHLLVRPDGLGCEGKRERCAGRALERPVLESRGRFGRAHDAVSDGRANGARDERLLGEASVADLSADLAPAMRVPIGPGSDESLSLAGRQESHALGYLRRRRVPWLVAHLRREAIRELCDRRPFGSDNREEQREVVHLAEREQLAPAPRRTAQAVAAPERALRTADAELVVHGNDGRSCCGVSPDALRAVARRDRRRGDP